MDNTIQFEFRNCMAEYLEEMKNIMNKGKKIRNSQHCRENLNLKLL
ncbi:MAG: hypothetical protein IKM97_00565 [Clostridia bacterium]|nr:hypothetical protein [Clostridia bacterium]